MARPPARSATCRFYGDLCDFLAGVRELTASLAEATTVKDTIEAVGVPHVEVGLVLVDGTPVDLGHRLGGGERLAVYPRFAPGGLAPDGALPPVGPGPARFALDGHLGTLARRLRLLGIDTWYRNHVDDRELVELAVEEDRAVLTRDVGLLKRRVLTRGAWIRATDPDRQLLEVVDRYALGNHLDPYSRCLRCNGPLRPATGAERAAAPPGARREATRFARCADCGHLYWRGSHTADLDAVVTRVRAHLDRPTDRHRSARS